MGNSYVTYSGFIFSSNNTCTVHTCTYTHSVSSSLRCVLGEVSYTYIRTYFTYVRMYVLETENVYSATKSQILCDMYVKYCTYTVLDTVLHVMGMCMYITYI